jgi:hypothetical protein
MILTITVLLVLPLQASREAVVSGNTESGRIIELLNSVHDVSSAVKAKELTVQLGMQTRVRWSFNAMLEDYGRSMAALSRKTDIVSYTFDKSSPWEACRLALGQYYALLDIAAPCVRTGCC